MYPLFLPSTSTGSTGAPFLPVPNTDGLFLLCPQPCNNYPLAETITSVVFPIFQEESSTPEKVAKSKRARVCSESENRFPKASRLLSSPDTKNGGLPLPDLSAVLQTQSLVRQGPPPTPMRKKSLSLVGQSFLRCHQGLEATCEKVGRGSFMEAFRCLENPAILYKTFHETRIRLSEHRLKKFMRHSLAQYQKALDLNLPIAKILNYTPEDPKRPIRERRYEVEWIPHAVDPRQWVGNVELKDLEKFKNLFEQAKALFNAAVENRIPLDLTPENCHCDDESVLKLIDFMEESSIIDYHADLLRALDGWANGNRHVLMLLSSDFGKWDTDLAKRIEEKLEVYPSGS